MEGMNEKKRVLQVNIDNNGGNGAFSLIEYLYTYLDDAYVFDYYTMGNFLKDAVYDSILRDGGICYSANLRKRKFLGHIILPFHFFNFLKNNNYEIVHIHSEVAYKQFLYVIAAHCAGVNKIIVHSHSSDIDGEHKKLKLVLHRVFRKAVNKLGTDFLACSMPSARWMFDDCIMKSSRFHIIDNGIAVEKYKFDYEKRNKVRKNLGVDEYIVLGHVGSLKKVKNQSFLIRLLATMDLNKYRLILVGDGEDRKKLKEQAMENGCENNIVMLGSRNDVNVLMQAFDVFLFPSLFEGVPMALIEAQTLGVPILASDRINPMIKVNPNVEFVPIDSDSIPTWKKKIEENLEKHLYEKGVEIVSNSRFNIKNSADCLRKVYQ